MAKKVNILGTDGDDNIFLNLGLTPIKVSAGDGNDIVTTGAGNDTLLGGAGNDSLIAGEGNNSVNGGSENDYIESGDGNDIIDAGSGDDFVFSRAGTDKVLGGAGNDVIIGYGSGTMNGGTGNDQLIHVIAGIITGPEIMIGGSGNDRIYGGGGHDSLDGGTGNDELVIAGNDVAKGGAGNDRFIFDKYATGTGVDATIVDFVPHIGKPGDWDTLDFSQLGDWTVTQNGSTTTVSYHAPDRSDFDILGDTIVYRAEKTDYSAEVQNLEHMLASCGGFDGLVDNGSIWLGEDYSYDYVGGEKG